VRGEKQKQALPVSAKLDWQPQEENMRRRKISSCLWLLLLIPVQGQPVQEPTLRDQVTASERAELDALKSGNIVAFTDLLADQAVFVDAAGPAPKSQVVKNVAEFRLSDYTMSDIHFVPLSPSSGLIVYRTAETGTSHGKNFSANVLISVIWARRNGKWVCLFSQETAAKY
jgi:hypothetical protein